MNPPPLPQRLLEYHAAAMGSRSRQLAQMSLIARILRSLGLTTMFVVLVVLFVGLLSGLAWFIGPLRLFGPMSAVLILLAIAVWMRAVRRRRAEHILAYLEQALRLNLPIPQMLDAAALGEKGILRRRLYSLRDALVTGTPIPAALEEIVTDLPRRELGMIYAANAVGDLPATLRRMTNEPRPPTAPDDASRWVLTRFYPLWLFGLIGGVAGFALIFLIPKYYKLLRDFKISPPPGLAMFLWASEWLLPAMALLVSLFGLLYLAMIQWEFFLPWDRDSVFRGLWDRMVWYTPIAGSLQRDRGLADLMGLLHSAVAAGQPFDAALERGQSLRLNQVLAARVRGWTQGVAEGQHISDAAAAAGIPPMVCGALRAAGPAIGDALLFLRSHYSCRFSRLVTLINASVIPLMALLGGAMVLIIARGIFEPMVSMVMSLVREVKVQP